LPELPGYTSLRLTRALHNEINNALADGRPLLLAVVDESGQPHNRTYRSGARFKRIARPSLVSGYAIPKEIPSSQFAGIRRWP
jgi:hypothetical protein